MNWAAKMIELSYEARWISEEGWGPQAIMAYEEDGLIVENYIPQEMTPEKNKERNRDLIAYTREPTPGAWEVIKVQRY
jgi:hypothetical protein